MAEKNKFKYREVLFLTLLNLQFFLSNLSFAQNKNIEKKNKNSNYNSQLSQKDLPSISLPIIVKEIIANSNAKKASEFNFIASEANKESAKKHWLPTLYIDTSAFQTNDPAQSFTGKLYQRAIRQSDFEPSAVNATKSNQFMRSTLGVNLSLYQGGAGQAQAEMASHDALAKKYNLKQTELEQYSYATATYIALVILKEQKIKLQNITKNINNILQNYSLRNQKNQIGYSGYLILEASYNKSKSFIIDNEEKTHALYASLRDMGFISAEKWQVADFAPQNNFQNYLNKYLTINSVNNLVADYSYKTSALKAEVDASKNYATIENAKNLPQLNLFAENYVFNGARDTRNGYSAGVNLRWNFYDPLTFDNKAINSNNIKASRHQYLAYQQQEKSEIEYLDAQIKSLKEAVILSLKNDELMYKNILLSQDLFRNGAINASNLSDAIMKYLDNFIYLANAQMQLIDLHAKKFTKQSINIHDFIGE